MTTTRRKKTTPKTHLQHHVRMAVVPHKKNSYRPHMIRRQGLAIVVAIVAVLQFGYNFTQSGSVLGQATSISSQALLDETNQVRSQNGVTPLRANGQLDKAAYLKAQNMFKEQYWDHVAPDGTQPWHWFKQANYSYVVAGENLAKGFHTSSGTVTAWMNSPEHRENMLGKDYQDVGFAVVSGSLKGVDTTVVVALYGEPLTPGTILSSTQPTILGAADAPLSIMARIGVGVQSMTPALLGSIVVLGCAAVVAVFAHAYRTKLPKPLRQSWYRHHGLYKALGMTSIVVVLLALYGGGQV